MKIEKTISRYNMLDSGDRVLAAVSWGGRIRWFCWMFWAG